MARIVLSGYYGFHNAGDEAILEATVRGLRACLPEAEIVVLSASPAETAALYGVAAADRWKWREIWRAIRGADLFVSGGGSLIQDATSRLSPYYYLGLIRLAHLLRTPVAIHAQGLGPIRSRLTAWWTARLFRKAVSVTVRDDDSRLWLEKRGVGEAKVVPDPAGALAPADDVRVDELEAELGLAADEKRLGVALRPWPGSEAAFDAVATVAQRAVEELSARPVLFACQAPGDVELAEELARRIGSSAVVVPPPRLASELSGLIGRCRLLVGMRLHSLIFAAARAVPFVALDYDPKIASFCESQAISCLSLDVTHGKLWMVVQDSWTGTEYARANGARRAVDLCTEAERNIRSLAGIRRAK